MFYSREGPCHQSLVFGHRCTRRGGERRDRGWGMRDGAGPAVRAGYQPLTLTRCRRIDLPDRE